MLSSYSTPTCVISHLGSRRSLIEQIERLGARRVALIGDARLQQAGVLDQFVEVLTKSHLVELATVVLAEVDPTVAASEAATDAAIDADADSVVGVGGGSALSLAKSIALLLRNSKPVSQYVGLDVAKNRPAPFIAVPTTAGSGSEVSNAFVLYDTTSNHNVGIRGRGYEPDVALLDGELLFSLPEVPMRDAAVDALSHGFEALWARGASRFTDTVAFEAIRTIRRSLPQALQDREPDDLQALLEASTLANFGCGNAGLALVHALSSASSVRIAHGRQNAILLPIVAEFNRSFVSDETKAEIDKLPELYEQAGVPTSFHANELPPHAAELMITAARESPFLKNNCRPVNKDELAELTAFATQFASTTARSPK